MSDRYDKHGHLIRQNSAEYLLWLDTYNAALAGLLSNPARMANKADVYHAVATDAANKLHGEQS